jgi:hypothetical protein
MTAVMLFDNLFNGTSRDELKWLSGARIHHREVPWSVAYGRADAGILFYHLALHAVRTFPERFEMVSLGGTAEDPRPLPGNRIGTHSLIRMTGDWTPKQLEAREKLVEQFMSEDFTAILEKHGMRRPRAGKS